jgi:hypothetical protein
MLLVALALPNATYFASPRGTLEQGAQKRGGDAVVDGGCSGRGHRRRQGLGFRSGHVAAEKRKGLVLGQCLSADAHPLRIY